MERVYLSLGSNLGDRLAMLKAAIRSLRNVEGVEVVRASRVYETEPWENEPGQLRHERAWYLNCVVAIDTTVSAGTLLARLQAIETSLGRTRPRGTPEAQRFAPRPLDIDILLYGNQVISVPDELHVPHLLLHERAFVLRPLVDVAPDVEHPTLYRTIRELAAELGDEHEVRSGNAPDRWFED
jgi:2-amino-4-hydroxy-6-hydroxymethyldihydropteridine diphosphokinase